MSLDLAPASSESSPSGPFSPRRGNRRLGLLSLGLTLVATGLEALAITTASGGAWGAATILAWFVIGLLVLSFVLGLVAILTGHGRRWGVAAVVVSVLANPLLLVWIFSALRATG